MTLIPLRTTISEVGSVGGDGVRRRTSTSVSRPRRLLKGATGHPPRRIFVVLLGGDRTDTFCDGSWMAEDPRGMDRVSDVAISAKSARVCGIILGDRRAISI